MREDEINFENLNAKMASPDLIQLFCSCSELERRSLRVTEKRVGRQSYKTPAVFFSHSASIFLGCVESFWLFTILCTLIQI